MPIHNYFLFALIMIVIYDDHLLTPLSINKVDSINKPGKSLTVYRFEENNVTTMARCLAGIFVQAGSGEISEELILEVENKWLNNCKSSSISKLLLLQKSDFYLKSRHAKNLTAGIYMICRG